MKRTSAAIKAEAHQRIELALIEWHVNVGDDSLLKTIQVITQQLVRYGLSDVQTFDNFRTSVAVADCPDGSWAQIGLKAAAFKLFDESLTKFTSFGWGAGTPDYFPGRTMPRPQPS